MATWQFWTALVLFLASAGSAIRLLYKLLEATYHTNLCIYQLTEQVKLMQGNTFQMERCMESLERTADRISDRI